MTLVNEVSPPLYMLLESYKWEFSIFKLPLPRYIELSLLFSPNSVLFTPTLDPLTYNALPLTPSLPVKLEFVMLSVESLAKIPPA